MYGNDLIQVVAGALKLAENELPVYPRKTASPIPSEVLERIKVLKSWRDSKAVALNMDSGMVCNNALITAIALKNPEDKKSMGTIKEMKKWQKTAFGREIITVLKLKN
jgi:ribonuclease D